MGGVKCIEQNMLVAKEEKKKHGEKKKPKLKAKLIPDF